MVDFTKDKSWGAAQVIENDADAGHIGKTDPPSFSVDVNSILLNGFTRVSAGASNIPVASSGVVLTNISSSVNGNQTFSIFTSDRMWFRRLSTTWMPWVELFHSSNAPSLPVTTVLAPAADNLRSLGDASGRWSEVFAGNGTINTSDAREKTEILPFTYDEIEASKQLSNEIGTYKFLASVDKKGDLARTHIGLTVQRAIEIMTANNLDPMSYGFICFDSWAEKGEAILDSEGEAVLDADDQPTYKVIKEAGDRYGFRYDQLNQFIIAGFNARLEAAGI